VSDTCVKRGDEPKLAKVSDTSSNRLRVLVRVHSRPLAQAIVLPLASLVRVVVSATWLARWWIRRCGGELWVWGISVGSSGTALIRTSTSRHEHVPFERVVCDDVTVWLQQGFAIDNIRIGWTPLTGFDVTWPGTIASLGGG
jgi:hypothetical protein